MQKRRKKRGKNTIFSQFFFIKKSLKPADFLVIVLPTTSALIFTSSEFLSWFTLSNTFPYMYISCWKMPSDWRTNKRQINSTEMVLLWYHLHTQPNSREERYGWCVLVWMGKLNVDYIGKIWTVIWSFPPPSFLICSKLFVNFGFFVHLKLSSKPFSIWKIQWNVA